eukprot:TRINITY_DN34793_c0_g1_i1.p1 TRINITY_DN34793_c0_g1~~TRINITY_DN34793_c0_g1_i1.p1  ORF type:complete len:646 (-),score=121.07 TRINITY_DN34793_c0_g1_i1:161-2098(-)
MSLFTPRSRQLSPCFADSWTGSRRTSWTGSHSISTLPSRLTSESAPPAGIAAHEANFGRLVSGGSAVSANSCRGTTASSSVQYADPGQTLIFFDWDDTLFPTTEIHDRWRISTKAQDTRWASKEFPRELESSLASWREALHQYLSVACSLSHCVTIVTASSRPWVERCIERFAPNLQELFDSPTGPRVVYAREAIADAQESMFSGLGFTSRTSANYDLTAGKLAAMKTAATEFYSRYPKQTWKNILSLGDMKYEHDAVQELALLRAGIPRERLRTKAIMLPRGASLSELTLRLQFSRLMLPAYVQFEGDIDLDLRAAHDPLDAIAEALNMPQLGEVQFPRHAWGRTPVPEEQVATGALLEVAVAVHDSLMGSALRQESKLPTFVSTTSYRSLRSGRFYEAASEYCPYGVGSTLKALVSGIAYGALATGIAFCVALLVVRSHWRLAEHLLSLFYLMYIFLVSVAAVSTLHNAFDPRAFVASPGCLQSSAAERAVAASRVWVLRPWAEDLATAMYYQSLGYHWADSMYVLVFLAMGQQPEMWASRLLRYVAHSVAVVACLVPGSGARVRCCMLGIAYLAESSLRLCELSPIASLDIAVCLLGFVGRAANLLWFVYFFWAVRHDFVQCGLRLQLVFALLAHVIVCTWP